MFLVLSGQIVIQLRDCDVTLGPNDVYVVPRGVERCPKSDTESSVLLFEMQGTITPGWRPSVRAASQQR